MDRLDPLQTLGGQLGIDFERDPFVVVVDRLVASGMASFRLNLRKDASLWIVSGPAGIKALNAAVEAYLASLENQRGLS